MYAQHIFVFLGLIRPAECEKSLVLSETIAVSTFVLIRSIMLISRGLPLAAFAALTLTHYGSVVHI